MRKLTPEQEALLKEFLACKSEAERDLWIQKERGHFQPAPEERQKMTFHSGGIGGSNRKDAEAHCEVNKAVILERTTGGQVFEHIDLYKALGDKEADRVFASVSEIYAESAQGRVRAFTVEARIERTFGSTELPKLLNNKDVTHINDIPRRDLLKTWHNDPTPEKLEARKEITHEISQSIKLISWEGAQKEGQRSGGDMANQQHRDARLFEVELDTGEKRLLQVEGMKANEKLEDFDIPDELVRQLEKQKPNEPLRLRAENANREIARSNEIDQGEKEQRKAENVAGRDRTKDKEREK